MIKFKVFSLSGTLFLYKRIIMNKLNFIKADKPDCSNATDSGKVTVTVREFITTTLAEKIATAL